jgi:hypothetical protein
MFPDITKVSLKPDLKLGRKVSKVYKEFPEQKQTQHINIYLESLP